MDLAIERLANSTKERFERIERRIDQFTAIYKYVEIQPVKLLIQSIIGAMEIYIIKLK